MTEKKIYLNVIIKTGSSGKCLVGRITCLDDSTPQIGTNIAYLHLSPECQVFLERDGNNFSIPSGEYVPLYKGDTFYAVFKGSQFKVLI